MIDMQNVFKCYRSHGHVKVVLDDISFRFAAGRSYGILGVNGAGKSTLMRILAGTELPNAGKVRRSARVSWPLGFSGGLHPLLTGRENVQFVARIFGADQKRVLTFVEDFAEVGAYMDVPIKTYSSGMIARLAFGLSIAIDFDCYLIDEVTAVGDARFAQRCRIEFEKRKRTSDIIMVSHSMETIQQYCNTGAVLVDGRLHFFTDVNEAIDLYKKLNA